MGKKLFFLSLVFLASVMARDWYANRPKEPKRPKNAPAPVAVTIARKGANCNKAHENVR
ncbi:MAG TPA: hypothetical protein PKO06_13915 [Candidatus Ozemobacteraceae bacterium]|nr:hypothetical protein [Candidatus Ozemobacteraceae bacterium]